MGLGRRQRHSDTAGRDPLTGLLSRDDFLSAAASALSSEGAPVAVLVVDLDGFRHLNDALGSEHGDLVLQAVGRRLTEAAGPRGQVARLGGDTFAAVVPMTSAAELRTLAWRVRDAVVQPTRLQGTTYLVGASVGACASGDGATALDLLRGAAAATRDAKTNQSGISLYQPGDAEEAAGMELAADLLIAIDSERTTLAFQPQFSPDGTQVAALEALARWTTEDGTAVSPARFFPIAERAGLVRKLTLLTLRQALAAAAQWRDAGVPTPVCVNLSTPVLADPMLVSEVRELLRRHDLDGGSLVLEVTETAAVGNRGVVTASLAALREAGVRVDLDDFGSGYASFAAIRELPLDALKVDRTLVAGHDGPEGGFLRAIVELAHSLGLQVVAEGVEDEAAWDAVRRLGCDAVQGFHLAPPVSPAEVVPMLQSVRERTPAPA